MAIYGDSLLRPEVPDNHCESPKRRSEISLDNSVARRKSNRSSVASSAHRDGSRRSVSRHSGYPGEYSPGLTGGRGSPPKPSSTTPLSPPKSLTSARTIPAWVLTGEDNDRLTTPSPLLLPSQPSHARVAEHHYAPQNKGKQKEPYSPSRDQELMDDEPYGTYPRESRWKTFAKATAYPRDPNLEEKLVTHDWMDENFGDYSQPWQGCLKESDLESGGQSLGFSARRKRWFERLQYKILRSPMVPLIIRMTVFIFSTIALALGGSIRYYSTKYHNDEGPSALMAIVVDAVALVYLVYITWDEYTGKPLGLRQPKAKMRLIFLDLIFIVFDSANLSLAFASLSEVTGACTSDAKVNSVLYTSDSAICIRQKALASVLLIALIAWLMTFAISVLRIVERVSAK